MTTEKTGLDASLIPDTTYDVKSTFGIEAKIKVPGFSKSNE